MAPSATIEPQPNVLVAVVANDHLALSGLLVEFCRMPSTPAVTDDLELTLDRRLRVHLAVCEHLLFPELASRRGDDPVDAALANHARLRAVLDSLSHPSGEELGDLCSELEEALADHIALEEDVVLPALQDEVGDRDMARLGFEFSHLADTGLDARPGPARRA
jgi:Hemerythrin HHE cation binding domain